MDNQEINKLKQAEEATLVTSNSLDGTSALTDPEDPVAPSTKVTRAPRISQNSAIEINPFLLAGLLLGVIVIWLLIASLKQLFRTNPYGEQIKIDNFSQYFREMPEDNRDSIFNSLYIVASNNSTEDTTMPKSGASIRSDSVNSSYDTTNDTYTSTFLVDIPDLQQTYNFWVYWSTDPDNTAIATAGYTVETFCPTEKQLIYSAFKCSDSQSSQGVTTDPIMAKIPVTVNYYENNYSKYIQYVITTRISDDAEKLTVVITNQYGDAEKNFKDALTYMRQELGVDPSNYTIEYIDESAKYEIIPDKAE